MENPPGIWKRMRHRLEWFGVRLMADTVPLLPRRACVALANALGAAFHAFDAHSRRVALANLEAVFGDRFSAGERNRIARASAQNLARTFLDLFWARNLNAGNYARYIHADGAERFREIPRRSGRGAIFMCHHFGNWEWLSLLSGYVGADVHFIAQEFKNPLLDEVFRRARESSGCRQINKRRALVRVMQVLRRGGAIGILGDLTVPPDSAAVAIDAFGLKMCVPKAVATFHRKLEAPVTVSVSFPQPDGTLRTEHSDALEFPNDADEQAVSQACWNQLEPHIRQHPEHWIWVYKHFRYIPPDATRQYPFYANRSRKFDKLLNVSPP